MALDGVAGRPRLAENGYRAIRRIETATLLREILQGMDLEGCTKRV